MNIKHTNIINNGKNNPQNTINKQKQKQQTK